MVKPGFVASIFVRVFSDNPTASVEDIADALVAELDLPEDEVALAAMLARIAFGRRLLRDTEVEVSEHYVLSDAEGTDIQLLKLKDSTTYLELEREAERRPDLWTPIGGDSNEVRAVQEARRLGFTPDRMAPPILFHGGVFTEPGHERVLRWVEQRFCDVAGPTTHH
jgi:hypothetical protein